MTNITFQSGTVLHAADLNALELSVPSSLNDGSVVSLPIAFENRTNTGIYRRSDTTALAFVVNGTEVLDLNSGTSGYNVNVLGTLNVTTAITVGGLPISGGSGGTTLQVTDGTNNETGISEIIFTSGATVSNGGSGIASIAVVGLPTLTAGQTVIGQSSGPGTAHAISGDATLSSGGVLTVTSLNNGANPIGTSGASLGLLNANKTDSGNNTFSGTATFSGTVTNSSGTVQQTRVVTAPGAVTVSVTDYIIVLNKGTGAATTVNLPSSPSTGRVYTIKDGKGDAATNNITITPNAGNIDGLSTLIIDVAYGSQQICYNGTQWNVVANSISNADSAVSLGATLSGSVSINMLSGNVFFGTVTGNTTFSVTNPALTGTLSEFVLEITNGGAHTVTWPGTFNWPGGTVPTLTTSGYDILSFYTRNGGISWNGFASGLNMAT